MSKAEDKNKKSKVEEETTEKSKVEEKTTEEVKEPQLYYFYSEGCAWCKRANPIVDELIEEGHPILKLDLADGDNRKLQDEIKKEYNSYSTNFKNFVENDIKNWENHYENVKINHKEFLEIYRKAN